MFCSFCWAGGTPDVESNHWFFFWGFSWNLVRDPCRANLNSELQPAIEKPKHVQSEGQAKHGKHPNGKSKISIKEVDHRLWLSSGVAMARLGNRLWQSSSHTSNIWWHWGAHVTMFCSTLAQNSQLKSKLVNSFLSRLSKTMLPLSPKPGQDHPKAQQQRKLTSTSPKSKPRSQIFAIKKETHFKFLAAFINYGGAFNKHGKSIPGPPQRCLKNSDSIFSLTCFYWVTGFAKDVKF